MRFIVYGAGAVGGALGGLLHEHGSDVVLIARGAQYDAVSSNGLALTSGDGEPVRRRIPVVDRPHAIEFGDDDVVVMAMKSQDTEAALQSLRASTSKELPVVCLQNGVANERAALRYFERVYGVAATFPAGYLEPGRVEAYAAPVTGILDLGRFPAGVDQTAREIAAVFGRSTFVSEARTAIVPWKYRKLIQNLGNAPLALCGPGGDTAELTADLRREGEEVLVAAGIAYTPADEWGARQGLIDMAGPRPTAGSTWQSLYRGSAVETDYLNGEIALIARLHGLSAPLNQAITRVVGEAARARVRPGSVSVDEVRRRLAEASLPASG